MQNNYRSAFTLVEVTIVVVLLVMISIFAYQVFFAQAEMVTYSMEFMQVNESLRRINTFMGADIKEASIIYEPKPVMISDVQELTTVTGTILHVRNIELDPYIPFNSPFGGQISSIKDIRYVLEKVTSSNLSDEAPDRFRLLRVAVLAEQPGQEITRRQVITENISELIVYRTVKRPFAPQSITSMSDRLLESIPYHESGTGNDLVHINMVLERGRRQGEETDEVYSIHFNTSFYKRGKEVFANL